MKLHMKNLFATGIIISATFLGITSSQAQTQVTLDPTQPWIGFMNVFNLPADGGAYQFGNPWGVKDLISYYTPGTSPYVTLTLLGNTNVWETTDTYWVKADKISPNKQMDANFYVQNDTLEGQNITFSGVCISNTFAAPYTSTVFIKEFNASYSVINSAVVTATTGQPFSISLQTGAGSHIQYGFETIGPDADPTNVYNLGVAIYQVQYPPIEASAINSQAAVVGQNVTFAEAPTGNPPFTYQWLLNGTPLSNSSHIAGATTNTLTISNSVAGDAGTYTVNITNHLGLSTTASAQLVLIPLVQAETNYCIDPSFETASNAFVSNVGWLSYGGTAFANTNDFYSAFDPSIDPDVTVIEGTNCLIEYSGGPNSYTGVFQDRPALPGQVYTADAWFFTPTITQGNNLVGNAGASFQIQFRDANGNLLLDYTSGSFTTNAPQGVWIDMPVTNKYANDFVTLLGTGPLIVSPPGTASMRIQPGYHAVDASGAGQIYIDMVNVTLRETFAVPSLSGSNFKLTFPTVYGPQYNVMYKTNLLSGAWLTLTSVPGDGTVKTVTDTVGQTPRFYIVNTSP